MNKMNTQAATNFDRITEAIAYIQQNFKEQPSLEEVAEHVHLSPYHFQRIFTEWAGVSPKKFLQFITLKHAKKLLKEQQSSLFDTAYESGLSGSGRLHDLFVRIEGMTPGEFKNGGENLSIHYSYVESPFGKMLIASTSKGVCHIAFADDEGAALQGLKAKFPAAVYTQQMDAVLENIRLIFTHDWDKIHEIKLHLKGTDFQLKVWETLLRIPSGQLATYGSIARQIERPKASRAVGTAIGDNPVAYLIPCHRVIQSSGLFGQYHWGSVRKAAMIGWEAVKAEQMLIDE
ncbi:AraC family transcriptional regulator of adaptative response/methylated-DNA-[protein]-cysteine methyltransferase [Catalinimonas alkaloidigena]|uniref:bifunctional helix-turn-helix domain-containing protein/methylated-DNA--[protein]-cysteine S-methyltransferase n=1 Tax=Catalinimonas alkaloidigena TaxID=1075417 RepID=UPI0030B87AC2|nr:AraC family transcriptional regulator of adaptative response/methylated-DNA-[protein]-cysteine methyltransferase [Catalinimonas alkaloidigena]